MARASLQEDEKDDRKTCRVVGQVKKERNRGDEGGMGGCRVRCRTIWDSTRGPRC